MISRILAAARRHVAALVTIELAIVIDTVGGLSFAHFEHLSTGLGLYWAVTAGTTVGFGDITPHTVIGHWISALVMLVAVPLFSATFSLFNVAQIKMHLHQARDDIKQHAEQLREGD